ncbi:hypothetical protein, partial [Escherichia coli]
MDKPYHRSIMRKYLNNKDRNRFISSFTGKYTYFNASLLSMHITPRINALFRTESYQLLHELITDVCLDQIHKHVNEVYKQNKRILANV